MFTGTPSKSDSSTRQATDARKTVRVTPYTTWNVAIDEDHSSHIDVSQVTKIQLRLIGFAMED